MNQWKKGDLIEVSAYDGKSRSNTGEVYDVTRDHGKRDTLIKVRLFTAQPSRHGPGEPAAFRNFWASKLRAA